MTENSYTIKALNICKDFMDEVKKAADSIESSNDIYKIKKPSTIEECHLLIDGLVLIGSEIENNRGFLGKIKRLFK